MQLIVFTVCQVDKSQAGERKFYINMEFNEKLQELRKRKGLTQEELASKLYVSRTAISKWESGRGYPSIDSLKVIARFFSVTVDELISSDEALTIAEENQRKTESNFRDQALGLSDIAMLLLLFLPLFAVRSDNYVREVSLLASDGLDWYLRAAFLGVVISAMIIGVLILALQNCHNAVWVRSKAWISLIVGVVATVIFVMTLQPYAAVFAFVMVAIKALILIKRQ